VTAEREQPGLIALDQRLEGAVMAAPDERHETLVRLQPEQRRSPCKRGETRGVLKCGSFQTRYPPGGHRSSA
jgi:hypothetical protein